MAKHPLLFDKIVTQLGELVLDFAQPAEELERSETHQKKLASDLFELLHVSATGPVLFVARLSAADAPVCQTNQAAIECPLQTHKRPASSLLMTLAPYMMDILVHSEVLFPNVEVSFVHYRAVAMHFATTVLTSEGHSEFAETLHLRSASRDVETRTVEMDLRLW